jgi:hypothetical protein
MATELRFPAFPGPQTLFSSRKGWWRTTSKAALGTAFGIFMILIAAPLGIFVTAFFGIFTIISIMMLMPGSSSLRIDGNGFETTTLFAFRKTYCWRDVSDFAEGAIFGKSRVVFNAEKQHLRAYEKLKAALTEGNNGYLPDNYGMSADDLARLMTSWRHFSMDAAE